MRGNRVAVIDIDPQGSLTSWHRVREKCYGEDYTGITFSSISGWRVGSEVSRLKKDHDYVIIDSPPHTETEARTAIRNADLLLIPVQPSPADVWATQATIDLAKAENIPFKTIMNRVTKNTKIVQMLEKDIENLIKTKVGNRVMFASSILEGCTALEVAPQSPAAQEIKDLSKEVLSGFKLHLKFPKTEELATA
jgi:chromosome partitioning protein